MQQPPRGLSLSASGENGGLSSSHRSNLQSRTPFVAVESFLNMQGTNTRRNGQEQRFLSGTTAARPQRRRSSAHHGVLR